MTSFWWLIMFFIVKFFIFRLKSVIYKKYTNANRKDKKYTNAMDISSIWLYWRLFRRLYCRLYCRLYWRLFCRLFCRLLFIMQYFPCPLFHKYYKFMTSNDASRMFLSCDCFCHFYLTQNPWEYSFRIYKHACLDFFSRSFTTTNSSSVNTSFSSWIVLRSPLSFRCHTSIALICLLQFFGIAE